jgi:methylated-DNA-protein-cysteine methyltransferase related protein
MAKISSGVKFSFAEVYKAVKKIPKGKVATYGQVAAYLSHPRAAQAVGWALAICDPLVVPWQRVVAKDGWLTIINEHLPADLQATLLKREGARVKRQPNGMWQVVDFEKRLWKPKIN